MSRRQTTQRSGGGSGSARGRLAKRPHRPWRVRVAGGRCSWSRGTCRAATTGQHLAPCRRAHRGTTHREQEERVERDVPHELGRVVARRVVKSQEEPAHHAGHADWEHDEIPGPARAVEVVPVHAGRQEVEARRGERRALLGHEASNRRLLLWSRASRQKRGQRRLRMRTEGE